MTETKTFFAPQLYIQSGVTDISFYTKALDAVELRRFENEDGSLHVAELSIDGMLFHIHEESHRVSLLAPQTINGSTTAIGLFVPDVDAVMKNAVAAGATEISPATDYEYGYRQGEFKDPFGHYWLIEQHIETT